MQEYTEYILGTLTLAYVMAFYTFAGIGLLFTLTIDYGIKKVKKKKELRFKLMFWLRDNWKRIIASIIAVFIVVRFYDYLNPQTELSMWIGFVTGAGLDAVIILLRKFTNINLFQSKDNG